jgi:hypothetical protein
MDLEVVKDKICDAISSRRIIRFYFNGSERTVEPYICGVSRSDKVVLVGFQINERGSGLKRWGWHMFDLAKISYLGVMKREFNIPRSTPRRPFNPLASGLKEVFCSTERSQIVERLADKSKAAAR